MDKRDWCSGSTVKGQLPIPDSAHDFPSHNRKCAKCGVRKRNRCRTGVRFEFNDITPDWDGSLSGKRLDPGQTFEPLADSGIMVVNRSDKPIYVERLWYWVVGKAP